MFRLTPFFMIAIWIAAVVGWVLNIIKLVGMDFDPNNISMMLVLRFIGILAAPLGAVLGYL